MTSLPCVKLAFRYQLVRRYDVSNRSVFSSYQWDVAKMSQIGPSHSQTYCDVVMTSQHGPRRPDLTETSLKRRIPGGYTNDKPKTCQRCDTNVIHKVFLKSCVSNLSALSRYSKHTKLLWIRHLSKQFY